MNEASARRLDIRAGGLELAGGDAVARLEAPDKVTLVDEPDRRRDLGGGLSLRQQAARDLQAPARQVRSEEHTSELQSLMRISYAVFCLKKKKKIKPTNKKYA